MSVCRAHRLLFSPPSFAGPSRHLGHAASSRLTLHGRNLSDRYRRLERALEGRKARSQEKSRLDAPEVTPVASKSATVTIPEKRPETFHGIVIPKEPPPPQDDECCMSNCAICVYDLYEESLDEYRQSVADVRSSLSAMKIPKTDWPSTIRAKNIQGIASRKEMVLSAFEEMERALAKKRESEDDSSSAGLSRLAAAASEGTFRRPRRPQARAVSWLESSASLYEGLRWLLFSKR